MMGLVLEAELFTLGLKADGSWKVTLETGELDGETVAKLSSLKKQWLKIYLTKEGVISDQHIEEIEKVEIISKKLKQKSPSSRMRSVLFKCHLEDNEDFEDFNDYYRHKMEIIIQHLESKLG